MSTQPDNPPGYPWNDFSPKAFPPQMTLRDWFAGQALIGIARNSTSAEPADYATDAYLLADAMLTAREAKP
jgi:hypothetical protein